MFILLPWIQNEKTKTCAGKPLELWAKMYPFSLKLFRAGTLSQWHKDRLKHKPETLNLEKQHCAPGNFFPSCWPVLWLYQNGKRQRLTLSKIVRNLKQREKNKFMNTIAIINQDTGKMSFLLWHGVLKLWFFKLLKLWVEYGNISSSPLPSPRWAWTLYSQSYIVNALCQKH